MAADLGSRLLSAGLVTRAQLARALSSAPPHGGALARELVRLGVEEDALAGFFLAEGYGPLMEREDLTAADRAAVRRLAAPIADALLALPVRSSPAGLVVAMADPSDRHSVEEIRYAVGQNVLPTVARVRDLRAAIHRCWPELIRGLASSQGARPAEADSDPSRIISLDEELGPEPEDAPIALVRRRPGPSDWEGSSAGEARAEAKRSNAPASPESEAVPLVRPKAWGTPAVGAPRSVSKTFSRPAEGGWAGCSVTKDFERVRTRDFEQAPEEEEPDPPAPPRRASDEPPPDDRWGDLSTPSSAPPRARPPTLTPQAKLPQRIRRSLGPTRRASQPGDVGPLLASIRGAATRDEVARLACEGAADVGRCAILLALRRGTLQGWTAAGGELSSDAVRNLFIPRSTPSRFQRVVGQAEPYLGPHGDSPADKLFKAAIGSRGGDVLLAPIVLSGRTVAVLAVDGLSHGERGRERVELLADAVAKAFGRIIVESKAGT